MNLPWPIESSMLLPKTQRNSMFPKMWRKPACMNIEVISVSHQGAMSRLCG